MEIAADPGSEQAMLRYMFAARPVHDLLRHALTQVAGYALFLMTSRGPATLAEGAICGAKATAATVADGVRDIHVPNLAAHHHHHLCRASEALTHACAAAITCAGSGATASERDNLIRALRAAVDNLRAVSRLIPGFEAVNFGQACCAQHATALQSAS